jgi:phospholipid transport system substrate-binding protein
MILSMTGKKSAASRVARRGAAPGSIGAFAIAALVLALASAPAAVRAAQPSAGGPMAVAQETVNQSLEVLRNKQVPLAERQEKLRKIVQASFDFSEMSRSALGYHWRTLGADQRQEFAGVFKTFIEDSYLSKINDYAGQQVEFIKTTNDGPQYAQVYTNIVQPGKDPIAVNYRLADENGQWKIYDVTVDAVSIIANYRNQFNRVMNNQGYAKLISDLKSKQAALAASLVNH